MKYSLLCVLALLMTPPGARADVPAVVADIAPVHSLVSIVMQGLGTPDLIVSPGVSAHGVSLRPSQARALQRADLVIWMGPDLTPRLSKPIGSLASGALSVQLLDTPGIVLLEYREEGGHDHGGGSHDDHDDHDNHDDHEAEEKHDPHAWLDPENARIWLGVIAGILAQSDPENADRYRANARAGQADLLALQSRITALLQPVKNRPYVTFHDAYQYFEVRFGLSPVGAVTASDATSPGPARLARLRSGLSEAGVVCAFSAPQFDPGMLIAAIGQDDLMIVPLDPMGAHLEVGPGLYPALLMDMARAFAGCATP